MREYERQGLFTPAGDEYAELQIRGLIRKLTSMSFDGDELCDKCLCMGLVITDLSTS